MNMNTSQPMGETASSSDQQDLRSPAFGQIRQFVREEPPEPDPVKWLIRGFRGEIKKLLLAGLILGMALGVLLFNLASPKYESHAVVRVAATQPFIMYEGNSMASRTFDAFVQAQVGMLAGPRLMEESAEALRATTSVDEISAIALSNQIRISESKSVIKIIATSDDPKQAQLFANTLLDSYLEAQRAQVRDRGSYRVHELKNREAELAERLRKKDDEILALGGEYGLDSAIVAHSNKLEVLQNSARDLEGIRRMIGELENTGSSSGRRIADDVLLKELVEDHALDLMLWEHGMKLSELAALELRYQPASKRIIEAKASIKVLEQAMADRREQIKTLKMNAEVPVDAKSREIRVGELREELAGVEPQHEQLEREARDLNVKIVRLRSMEKEASTLRDILDETKRALDKVQLESRLDVPGAVEVVARAPLPLEATKDHRKVFGLFGLVAGMGVIIGLFLLKLILKPTVRFTDDLECFDHEAPFVGQLQPFEAEGQGNAVDMNVYRLRNNIQLCDLPPVSARKARVITVSTHCESIQSNRIARELGASFTTSGLKTLVVEACPAAISSEEARMSRSGWLHLVSKGEIAADKDGAGTSIMSNGGDREAAQAQVSLRQVRQAVGVIADQYDVVLIDVGAPSRNLAAEFIVSQSDVTVLATRPESSSASLRRALNQLKAVAPHRIRLVMSEMRMDDPKLVHA